MHKRERASKNIVEVNMTQVNQKTSGTLREVLIQYSSLWLFLAFLGGYTGIVLALLKQKQVSKIQS